MFAVWKTSGTQNKYLTIYRKTTSMTIRETISWIQS